VRWVVRWYTWAPFYVAYHTVRYLVLLIGAVLVGLWQALQPWKEGRS